MKPIILVWLAALAALGQAQSSQVLPLPERGFLSTQPANRWDDALISGNGVMGAMVYGQPSQETVVLSRAGLFMPLNAPILSPEMGSHSKEIRQLVGDGKYKEAADLAVALGKAGGVNGLNWTDPFIPAFDLILETAEHGSASRYARSVDFSTGVTSVGWEDDSGTFQRRLFVSRADNVVVLSFKGSKPGTVSTSLRLAVRPSTGQGGNGSSKELFDHGIASAIPTVENGWLTYRSSFTRSWPGSIQGYEGVARVVAQGGSATPEGDHIEIRNADEVLVLVRIDILKNFAKSHVSDLKEQLSSLTPDFDLLLDRHRPIHSAIFNRTRLDLDGGSDRRLSSEELIARSKVGETNRALLEKQYDAARYNIISCTGELPPALTGIWIGTWGADWSGDFTMDGNLQTAIEGNLALNMPELMLPYFDYLESQMSYYRDNAKQLYGARGIFIPSRTSSHGWINHFNDVFIMPFWTAGAGWAAHFYYDYYLYTGDKQFLRDRAVPFMKETARFYEDFLTVGPDGRYMFSPSYSPENSPGNMPDGMTQASLNATMDIAVARELLTNLIAACETLQIEKDGVKRWKLMLTRLPAYMISPEGAIKEWSTPLLTDNYEHRHSSHLYGLYYGMPAAVEANPKLQQAFQKAVELRMNYRQNEQSGFMAFGLVQLGDATASLHDVKRTYQIVEWLANWYWTSALTTTHNKHSLFNMDISGGMPNLVARMLVDSRPGLVDLLPTLPPQWPNGRIIGIRARGGFEVDVAWKGGMLNSATIRSIGGNHTTIRYRGKTVSVILREGQSIQLDSELKMIKKIGRSAER